MNEIDKINLVVTIVIGLIMIITCIYLKVRGD